MQDKELIHCQGQNLFKFVTYILHVPIFMALECFKKKTQITVIFVHFHHDGILAKL